MSNQHSALLINEEPLQVLPSLAVAILKAAGAAGLDATGLNEAMVLQQLHYWLRKPRQGVVVNGRKWIYNSYSEWQENFPFWSERTVQRIFLNLERLGLVVSDTLGGRDRRKWYAIDYDKVTEIEALAESLRHTHTTPPDPPKLRPQSPRPSRQVGTMHDAKEALSDAPTWHHASRQVGTMEDDNTAPSARQVGTMLIKVSETTQRLPENTHTAPTSAPPVGGVCVPTDELIESDYYDFARANSVGRGGSFKAPDAWAATHWPLRDRDLVVREWKARQSPEAVEAARTTPPDNRMKLGEARNHVRAIRNLGAGHDLKAAIRQLHDTGKIGDDVRDGLLTEFCDEAASARGSP